jgi:hypothetical protein
VHVGHVAEAGAWIIRVAAALCDQSARFDVSTVRDIELPDVAVQKGNGVALVIRGAVNSKGRAFNGCYIDCG